MCMQSSANQIRRYLIRTALLWPTLPVIAVMNTSVFAEGGKNAIVQSSGRDAESLPETGA